MKTIWKFHLQPGKNEHLMPRGAAVLTAQMQLNTITLWMLVDTEMQKHLRVFDVYGTGHEVAFEHGKYIATVQQGWLVWHVFEGISK